MCRALVYLGQPVLVDDLLFKPDSSLVKQSFMPQKLAMLNLAGFGMMAWDDRSFDPTKPFSYSSPELPVFDRNLKAMAEKIEAHCLLAHVRGVQYSTKATISNQNTHPFCFPGCRLAMAHNGDLNRIDEMKPDLLEFIDPAIGRHISGTTDSEWIYALLMSQFDDPAADQDAQAIREAVEAVLKILQRLRRKHGIDVSSSANLFIADGNTLAAVRFCFDFGRFPIAKGPGGVHEANLTYLSLWYTSGREFGFHEDEWKMIGGSDSADSVIVASEPLTRDTTSWLEVPEYSMLHVDTVDGRLESNIHYLNL